MRFRVGALRGKVIGDRVDFLVERFQEKPGLIMLFIGFLAGIMYLAPESLMTLKNQIECALDIFKKNLKMILFHNASTGML